VAGEEIVGAVKGEDKASEEVLQASHGPERGILSREVPPQHAQGDEGGWRGERGAKEREE